MVSRPLLRGLLVIGGLLALAGLPYLSRTHHGGAPWALGLVGGYYALHALVGAVALMGLTALAPAPAARVARAVATGLAVAWVAIDARVWALMGLHADGGTVRHLFQEDWAMTLGITRADLLTVAVIVVGAGALVAVAVPVVPGARTFAKLAAVLVALDALGALGFAVARFEGVRPLVGLGSALPAMWQPRLEATLTAALGRPARATDDDLQFPPFWDVKPRFGTFRPAPLPTRSDSRPDVLLVVVESLRADALEAMPHVRALAEGGLVAERHYSSGNCSFLGNFSLLTGLEATYWGIDETWRSPVGLGAFVSLGYDVYLSHSAALNFDMVSRVLPPGAGEVGARCRAPEPNLRDAENVERLLARFAAPREKPVLAVLFFDASHWPYWIDGDRNERSSALDSYAIRERASEIKATYLRSLAGIDQHIGRVVAELTAPGRRAPLIVVTGDHGEAFGDHGVFMHGSRLDEEQLRVPLVMRGPGIAPGRVARLTSHRDVLPTVLAALGAAPSKLLPGAGADIRGAAPATWPLAGSCGITFAVGFAVLAPEHKILMQLGVEGPRPVGAVGYDDVPRDALTADDLRAIDRATEYSNALFDARWKKR